MFSDPSWSFPGEFVEYDDHLYFTPTDYPGSLWKTDGSVAGTVERRLHESDDVLRAYGSSNGFVGNLRVVGDVLSSAAKENLHGQELWALRRRIVITRQAITTATARRRRRLPPLATPIRQHGPRPSTPTATRAAPSTPTISPC